MPKPYGLANQILCYFQKRLNKKKKKNAENKTKNILKVSIAANQKDVCLQNTSKPHSYHLKIW